MAATNNDLYERINLNTIIDNLMDKLQEPTPDFLLECEKDTEKELEAYTKYVVQHLPDNESDIVTIVESYDGKILDSICKSNRAYFETGIKLGAVLLLQLLDL